ncbi:hypothetical protein EKH55_2726 [Sinorhizobium alkalisoli]|nr:hypothetical protein EKH55_2726 [Sinorhizobium alkalisoli]
MPFQRSQGSRLIGSHEAAVAHDVGCEDCGQAAFQESLDIHLLAEHGNLTFSCHPVPRRLSSVAALLLPGHKAPAALPNAAWPKR